MNETTYLPHEKLIAYGVARDLVVAVVCGDTSAAAAAEVHRLASRLTAMLAPLARRR